ncbi:collagen alpha-1(I) chain-like [Oryx dammah]|uniref:collagen alpha-1(I) chain-like n=1 Tax=Oryx dammah TaxID=59534 RepID=UPI001A9BBAD9|nr:collagen alpha-1(I) chain-like [Oryx dammah]
MAVIVPGDTRASGSWKCRWSSGGPGCAVGTPGALSQMPPAVSPGRRELQQPVSTRGGAKGRTLGREVPTTTSRAALRTLQECMAQVPQAAGHPVEVAVRGATFLCPPPWASPLPALMPAEGTQLASLCRVPGPTLLTLFHSPEPARPRSLPSSRRRPSTRLLHVHSHLHPPSRQGPTGHPIEASFQAEGLVLSSHELRRGGDGAAPQRPSVRDCPVLPPARCLPSPSQKSRRLRPPHPARPPGLPAPVPRSCPSPPLSPRGWTGTVADSCWAQPAGMPAALLLMMPTRMKAQGLAPVLSREGERIPRVLAMGGGTGACRHLEERHFQESFGEPAGQAGRLGVTPGSFLCRPAAAHSGFWSCVPSTRGPCPPAEPAPWSERQPAPHCDPRGSERPPGRPRPPPPFPGLVSQHRPSPSPLRPGAAAQPRAQARRQGLSLAGKVVPAAAHAAGAGPGLCYRRPARPPAPPAEADRRQLLARPPQEALQPDGRRQKPGGRSPKGGPRGAAQGESAALRSRRQPSRKRRAGRACAPPPRPRSHVTWGYAPVAPGSRLPAPPGNASRAASGSGRARWAPGDAVPADTAPRRQPRCVACALGVRGCGDEGSAVRRPALPPPPPPPAPISARGVASRRRRDGAGVGDDLGRRAAAALRESGQRREAERGGAAPGPWVTAGRPPCPLQLSRSPWARRLPLCSANPANKARPQGPQAGGRSPGKADRPRVHPKPVRVKRAQMADESALTGHSPSVGKLSGTPGFRGAQRVTELPAVRETWV